MNEKSIDMQKVNGGKRINEKSNGRPEMPRLDLSGLVKEMVSEIGDSIDKQDETTWGQ